MEVSTVYPRSRGEHCCLQKVQRFSDGLSPLARGTLIQQPSVTLPLRFIPARAGNTIVRTQTESWAPVYPRSRGEHFTICGCCAQFCGLSPLARGTLHDMWLLRAVLRFIPARAGNTWQHDTGARLRHGLSPLARGTPACYGMYRSQYRFIPARAGNTVASAITAFINAVYPRSRGEHAFGRTDLRQVVGLSLLARGKRAHPASSRQKGRFIPACAGNTQRAFIDSTDTAVYPRLRGEHKASITKP